MARTHEIESRLALEKQALIEMLPVGMRSLVDKHSYLAGGCIYSLFNEKEPHDFDLFLDNTMLAQILRRLPLPNANCRTENAITFGKHQIVTRFSGKPEKVVGEFDFLHNMFYFDGQVRNVAPWHYLFTDRLVFNRERARDICGTIMRIPKFVDRGMRIDKSEIAAMLQRLDGGHFDARERELLGRFGNKRRCKRQWHDGY